MNGRKKKALSDGRMPTSECRRDIDGRKIAFSVLS